MSAMPRDTFLDSTRRIAWSRLPTVRFALLHAQASHLNGRVPQRSRIVLIVAIIILACRTDPPASSMLATRVPNVIDGFGRSVRQWRVERRTSHKAELVLPTTCRKSGPTITSTFDYMPWAMIPAALIATRLLATKRPTPASWREGVTATGVPIEPGIQTLYRSERAALRKRCTAPHVECPAIGNSDPEPLSSRGSLDADVCRPGVPMQHMIAPAPYRLAVLGLLVSLACAPKEATDKSVRVDSPAAVAAPTAAKIPITSSSDEARTFYTQGRDLSEQLRNQDARKLFEQAAAKDSTFAMAHYSLALTAPTTKEFLQHLSHAVALSEKASDGERLLILALDAGSKANPAKALQYAEEIVAKYPADERAHFSLGNAYVARQQNDKAITEFKKAIEINPSFSPAYNSLGYAYRPLGNDAEAEKAFKKYIELLPNDPNPYDSYAELLMKTGRFDESIQQYRKALSVDKNFGSSHVGIAADLMFQGKHDEAIAEAQKLYDAARDDGDRRTALFSQVVTHIDAGKTAQALQQMEQLYALGSKAADTATMSGDAVATADILLDAGRVDEARQHYDRSLALLTGSSASAEVKEDATLAAHYNKGRVALAKNDLATATTEAAEFLKGAEAKQNDVRIRQAHALGGTIAQKERKFDDAIAEFGKANQQDPYVLYMTALAYKGKGDTAKAKELAQQAANANALPTLNSAFVRVKAKTIG
jgi:tetratricopeptide (TPR) repeat protein